MPFARCWGISFVFGRHRSKRLPTLGPSCELGDDTVVHQGKLYRFKQVVDKEWMTLWGKVVVARRLYQRDRGGPSRVPLDERCGMVKRFMVPERERVTAFLGAGMVPAEVRDCLGELLPEPPSRTAIQYLLTTVGQYAEDHAEQLELALQEAAPLDPEGDTLVVTELPCPTDTQPDNDGQQTAPRKRGRRAWSPFGFYLTPLDPEAEEPQRVDVRYAARMPEAKMETLVNGLVDQTGRALQQGSPLGYFPKPIFGRWSGLASHSTSSNCASATVRLSRFGLDPLQWSRGGSRQDPGRPSTQTQRHALDARGRTADSQLASPRAIETMGGLLELVP